MFSAVTLEEVDGVVHHLRYLLLVNGSHSAYADGEGSSKYDPVGPEQVCVLGLMS